MVFLTKTNYSNGLKNFLIVNHMIRLKKDDLLSLLFHNTNAKINVFGSNIKEKGKK